MVGGFRGLGHACGMMKHAQAQAAARRAMRWSLSASFLMLALKLGAWALTGSAAILGDAAESVVHLAAVFFASFSLALSQRPPDANHPYGHSKVAFISAGVEGALILAAAVFIAFESVRRWVSGLGVVNLDQGMVLTGVAILVNLALGLFLMRAGRRLDVFILRANGRHVLTDAWTSLGALAGLAMTVLTGSLWWDPLFGLLIAANILFSGWGLVRESVTGLMDEADPAVSRQLEQALAHETSARGVSFHALRHRNSGHLHHVDVHLLFPDGILLRDAHRRATEIERAVIAAMPVKMQIITHLETCGDHDKVHAGDPDA
ncbi:MAG TPA: cation transporter [Verrucomicrobiales bacterium]|nr:cation transporter [Verrucomicrobiales bacterium]